MPFKDKAFDFVIAFHVLEHIPDPAALLLELQRVSKAGYIETPSVLVERIVPYETHVLEVGWNGSELLIQKKRTARPDPAINSLELVNTSKRWRRMFYGNPDLFHVCYLWKNSISFTVLNPSAECTWFEAMHGSEGDPANDVQPRPTLRSLGLSALRRYHVLRKRRRFTLNELLACPVCNASLTHNRDTLTCTSCAQQFKTQPVCDFTSPLPI
jgi:SAM-dependent methyltransferase